MLPMPIEPSCAPKSPAPIQASHSQEHRRPRTRPRAAAKSHGAEQNSLPQPQLSPVSTQETGDAQRMLKHRRMLACFQTVFRGTAHRSHLQVLSEFEAKFGLGGDIFL